MARLTAAQRRAAPHAGPHGSFPIPDTNHARLALAEAHYAANPAAVRAKVHRAYPSIDQASRPAAPPAPKRSVSPALAAHGAKVARTHALLMKRPEFKAAAPLTRMAMVQAHIRKHG